MLGGTEYVAEAAQAALERHGHSTMLHFQPNFAEITQQDQTWLICTSTHGAGDFPENIESFVHDLNKQDQLDKDLKYLVIAVGDSNYDTFCEAGKTINNIMLEKRGKQISDIFTINIIETDDPEAAAEQYIESIIDRF